MTTHNPPLKRPTGRRVSSRKAPAVAQGHAKSGGVAIKRLAVGVVGGPIEGRAVGGAAGPRFWGGPDLAKRVASRNLATDAAATPLRVLCVHGVGDHHTNLDWTSEWQAAIKKAVAAWDAGIDVQCDFLLYDDLFENSTLDAATYGEALFKLGGSGLVAAGEAAADSIGHEVDNILSGIEGLFHQSRGLADIPGELRWTAGMVAQWANDDDLRRKSRERVTTLIQQVQPHIILAHSLGTLICYDTFRQDQGLLGPAYDHGVPDGRTLIVFGSQIGNPFVRGTFGGYVGPLTEDKHWYQLFNPNDRAFTAQINVTDDKFTRVQTPFTDGFLSHDAVCYISHPSAAADVWQQVVARSQATREFKPITTSLKSFRSVARKPNRRALLVGINEYPDPQNRLSGCINDIFRMSAALQQSEFDPQEIRVVFDDRATATGIMDRLHWLLDGTCSGDERVFVYSGHGAQMPVYDPNGKVDHLSESLVPYDFDWSRERAITDGQFAELYSQLPYDCRFLTILDCCHAGGLGTGTGPDAKPNAGTAASPGRGVIGPAGMMGAKVRGPVPPDDVRHRAIQWDVDTQMWVARELKKSSPDKDVTTGNRGIDYTGRSGTVHRFGRAVGLRLLKAVEKRKTLKALDHKGPFVPVVLQACQENQLAYEYRDGVTSYGAFSFAVTQAMRDFGGKNMSFQELAHEATRRLRDKLKFDQTPCLFGPRAVVKQEIPWREPKKIAAGR